MNKFVFENFIIKFSLNVIVKSPHKKITSHHYLRPVSSKMWQALAPCSGRICLFESHDVIGATVAVALTHMEAQHLCRATFVWRNSRLVHVVVPLQCFAFASNFSLSPAPRSPSSVVTWQTYRLRVDVVRGRIELHQAQHVWVCSSQKVARIQFDSGKCRAIRKAVRCIPKLLTDRVEAQSPCTTF